MFNGAQVKFFLVFSGEGHNTARRSRLPTEPGPNCSYDLDYTSAVSSPVKSPPYNSAGDSDDSLFKSK